MIFSRSFLTGACFGLIPSVIITYLAMITTDSSTGSRFDQYTSNFVNQANESVESTTSTQLRNVHEGITGLSGAIKDSVRIVCFVMTQPKNHASLALTVRATWGKRCTKFFFVSTEPVAFPADYNRSAEPADLPPLITAVYHGNESREILWEKTKIGFQFAYDQYFDDADWFLKADDDSYLIMENLRWMLLDKNPSEPGYYGCKLTPFSKTGYNQGGAGYVLSKEALKRFIEQPSTANFPQNGPEDILMSQYLLDVGIVPGDSRDSDGKPRFFDLPPSLMINTNIPEERWILYFTVQAFKPSYGVDCCSDKVVSFHHIKKGMHWLLEYLIYHVHPYGVHAHPPETEINRLLQTYLIRKNAVNITKSVS